MLLYPGTGTSARTGPGPHTPSPGSCPCSGSFARYHPSRYPSADSGTGAGVYARGQSRFTRLGRRLFDALVDERRRDKRFDR